jgi:hypothetical protein
VEPLEDQDCQVAVVAAEAAVAVAVVGVNFTNQALSCLTLASLQIDIINQSIN